MISISIIEVDYTGHHGQNYVEGMHAQPPIQNLNAPSKAKQEIPPVPTSVEYVAFDIVVPHQLPAIGRIAQLFKKP